MQEDGGGNADLDGRTLESCFLVGAATFIMNAGGDFRQHCRGWGLPLPEWRRAYGACSLSSSASHRGSSALTESTASHSWGGSTRRSVDRGRGGGAAHQLAACRQAPHLHDELPQVLPLAHRR